MPRTIHNHVTGEDTDLTIRSVEKAQFIDWLAVPKHLREPSSLMKMAEALDVTPQTLRAWKRDPRTIEQVRGKIQGQLTISELPDILESLLIQAKDPLNTRSVQAARLLVDMMEKAEAKQTHNVEFADMTNEQLRALAAGLHDEVDERIVDRSA